MFPTVSDQYSRRWTAVDTSDRIAMTEGKRDMRATVNRRTINGRVTSVPAEDAAALILDDCGMIRDCNRAGEALFKYRRRQLVWRPVSMLLPQLLETNLLQDGQLNERLRFLCRIAYRFEAVAQDGERFVSALFLNLLGSTEHRHLSLIVRPAEAAAGGSCGRFDTESERALLRCIAA
jgi:PAS domain-containing protein